MPASQRLSGFLHAPEMGQLMQQALVIKQLDKILHSLLPPALTQHVRVQVLTAGRLSLLCSSPAHAAKLRQLGKRITDGYTARGFEVTAIQVETQASPDQAYRTPSPRPPRDLPDAARAAFDQLAESLPESELQQSVRKLLRSD